MATAHRHLCKGIDRHVLMLPSTHTSIAHSLYPLRADSVTWNPHKSMHVPLQCSAFLIRHSEVLQHMLTTKASYLFMKDKVAYDTSLDTGDKSLQCGRLNDALKIWLTLKKNVSATSC